MELRTPSSIVERLEKDSTVLTTREVAELVRVSEMTIYRLAKAGDIPSFKIGNSLRFDAKALASWLRQRMHPISRSQVF